MEANLFKPALLDAIVPHDTTRELSDILQDAANAESDSNSLLAVKERNILFFDERLRTLAVLRLPHCDEDTLNSYISRLSYKIDVWAVDESPSHDQTSAAASPPKDLVFTVEAIQKHEPVVLASQSADGGQILTLVWEVEVVLNRPRFRVPQPAIILIPSATINASQKDEQEQDGDLTPFRPLESNVLEPMRFIPGLRENPPFLAASRLERVLPIPATYKQRIHISHVPSRRHRAVPATIARTRYHKINTLSPVPTTIALLDMEIIPFVQIEASIEQVHLSLKNGRAESLTAAFLPMRCRSGDCLTFMHNLHQASDSGGSPGLGVVNPNLDLLSVVVRMEILLTEHCRPVIVMDWTTHVDFTQALNPAFGPPAQPIQRPNRPSGLPITDGNGLPSAISAMSTSIEPTLDGNSRSGLSISFTAPNTPARVGHPFILKILVVNHSLKMAKLAIIPLPRIQRQTTHAQVFAKRHAPKSSTASFHPSERRHTKSGEDMDIAQAIIDENVVYAMHHSNVVPPDTDLMALTAELRIGPLAPGQCHESEIQMVAFETGCLRMDAMRVVDLVREAEEGATAAGVVADIRDLPDVVVANTVDGAELSAAKA